MDSLINLQVAITRFAYIYYYNKAEAPNIFTVTDLQKDIIDLINKRIQDDNRIVTATKTN